MDIKSLPGSPFRSLALASVVCLLGVAQAGATQPASGVSSVTISYHDLNLSTIEGANALYQRIRLAADTVCGYKGRTLLEQGLWATCFNEAVERAVASVDQPTLTSVHAHTSHRSV